MRSRLPLLAIAAAVAVVVLGPALVVAIRAERGAASFGDRVDVGMNHVSSAEVSVELGNRTVLVTDPNLAPGDQVVGRFELVNTGTVPVHFSVEAVATNSPLASWLTWRFVWSPDDETCPVFDTSRAPAPGELTIDGPVLAAAAAPLFGDPAPGVQPGDRSLAIGERDVLCLVAALSIDAPNSVQSRRLDQQFRIHAEQDLTTPENDG